MRTQSGMGFKRPQRCDKTSKLVKTSVRDPVAVLQAVSVTSALDCAEQHTREVDCTGWQSSSCVIKKSISKPDCYILLSHALMVLS